MTLAGRTPTVRPAPRVVVVMGVSGSGKTTVGALLARRLDWPYLEGDDFHPPANVAKMHRGEALTDADRAPWLDSLRKAIDRLLTEGHGGVVTCSALRRSYRDRLIGARPEVALVYLRGARGVLAQRMEHRQGHFMPASLLDSQLATLEEPAVDEHAITLPITSTPEELVQAITAALEAHEGGGTDADL